MHQFSRYSWLPKFLQPHAGTVLLLNPCATHCEMRQHRHTHTWILHFTMTPTHHPCRLYPLSFPTALLVAYLPTISASSQPRHSRQRVDRNPHHQANYVAPHPHPSFQAQTAFGGYLYPLGDTTPRPRGSRCDPYLLLRYLRIRK